MTYDLTFWKPMRPTEAAELFEDLKAPWWVSGGWAIDLFLGRQTREHHDLDIGLFRADQLAVRAALSEWEMHAADPPGTLRPWPGDEVLPTWVHDIWCRKTASDPWEIQLMLSEGDGENWISRRIPAVRRAAGEAIRRSSAGIPFLAPEVQLYFKAKNRNERDELDFAACLPAMTAGQRQWLAAAVSLDDPDNAWLSPPLVVPEASSIDEPPNGNSPTSKDVGLKSKAASDARGPLHL